MCKHILINDFNKDDFEVIKTFISKTNENDGYGAIIKSKNGDIQTLKAMHQGVFYFDLMAMINETMPQGISSLVVHHRTSTNGKGIDYAHPFQLDGYFLTHNGVVDVPNTEAYNTRTTNDSEALLHHLLATNYATNQVSGYYSVFLISADRTQIIVDDIAPIYSDGRVFCSHNLGDNFKRMTKTHVIIDASGNVTCSPIETMQSNYGMDKAHLSLGNTKMRFKEYDSFDDWNAKQYIDDTLDNEYDYRATSNVDDFLFMLTDNDYEYIAGQKNRNDRILAIKDTAQWLYIKLTKRDIKEILGYFNKAMSA